MTFMQAVVSIFLFIAGVSILNPKLLDINGGNDTLMDQVAEILPFDVGASSSSPSNTANSTGVLDLGDKGDAVKTVQNQLRKLNLYAGSADGVFGQGTEAAVKRFQQQQGLNADGKVGPTTRTRLNQATQATTTAGNTTSGNATAVRALW